MSYEYTDKEVLDSIHALLDGTEWSPDTLHIIADLLRIAGYSICDIPDNEEDIS